MKIQIRLLIITTILCLGIFTSANFYDDTIQRTPLDTYSRVKVYVKSPEDIMRLQQNDITVEHYKGNTATGIELDVNQAELSRLRNLGMNYEIEIENLDKYYAERKAPDAADLQLSRNILSENNVTGFSYGSVGGYYSYNEIGQKLDSMRLMYPNLISVKQSLGNSTEARPIWMVKISDNPDINESATEAPIYFDALHHAREPQAMACVMYYMYWLLDNYGTNPEATYLVNNREIYFVPVANPDGYVYNQTIAPNGGGSWRKNRRNNGSSFGVDLNRNYPYGWGNNSGSSNDPTSETYRGPSAASEPETQAIKNFLLAVRPKIGFSTHSYAGRYLNPYSYNDTAASYDIYSEFSSAFAASNNYTYGTVIEMLAYYSSGTTRDYMHSIGGYCWTPEVGGSDFWPLQSEIIPVANETLYGMKYLSWVGGAYADYLNYSIPGNGYVLKNDTLQLQVTLKNRGLSQTSKNVTTEITSLYANATGLNTLVNFDSIPSRTYKNNSDNLFKFKISSAAVYMDEMKFIISVKQEGVETSRDTIRINVGKPNVLYASNSDNGIAGWTRAGTGVLWDTTFIDPNSGRKNFADSRYGNSKDNSNNTFMLNDTINLAGAVNPRIEFSAKWATELTFDYIRIQVSTNFGSSWTNLAGRYTTLVSGQPSYTGIKHWKYEQINLNAYVGQRIKVRFILVTDGGVPGDGFYFDEFRIVNYIDGPVGISSNESNIPDQYQLSQNYPNPFNPSTVINYQLPFTGHTRLNVYDVLGNKVVSLVDQKQNAGSYSVEFSGANYPSGIYYYKLEAGNFSEVRKMILVK